MKRINLIPEEARKISAVKWLKRELAKNRLFQAAFITVFFLIALSVWGTTSVWRYRILLKATKQDFSAKTKELQEKNKLYKFFIAKKKELKERQKILQKQLGILEKAARERVNWTGVLVELPDVVSEDLWFKKIVLKKDMLILQGGALDNDIISDFMKMLDDSTIFSDTSFNYTKTKETKGKDIVIDFEITTHFKVG